MRYVRCTPCKIAATFVIAILAFAELGSSVLAKDADSYLKSAQNYAAKGNLRAAEIELRNGVQQELQNSLMHARLAEIYLKLGEFSFAEREARSARNLQGAEENYLLTLAEAMRRQGKSANIQAE